MNIRDTKIINSIIANTPGLTNGARYANTLIEISLMETKAVLERNSVTLMGLSEEEAEIRQKKYGLNELAREKKTQPI
jgi:magnesium-transporting ATPase (P-type)